MTTRYNFNFEFFSQKKRRGNYMTTGKFHRGCYMLHMVYMTQIIGFSVRKICS